MAERLGQQPAGRVCERPPGTSRNKRGLGPDRGPPHLEIEVPAGAQPGADDRVAV